MVNQQRTYSSESKCAYETIEENWFSTVVENMHQAQAQAQARAFEKGKKKETRSRIRRRKRARLRIKYKTVVFGTAARDLRARIPQYRLRPLTAPINIQRWQLVTPHHANFKPTTTLNILRLLNRSRVQLPNNLRKRERERDADRVR